MRVVQFQTVISGNIRCSLRYDLAYLIVCFLLITYIFPERTAVEVFRHVIQIPGGFRGSSSTAPGSGDAAFAGDTQDNDLYA